MEQILREINKTSIQIDNQDHLHAALVFGYIPKQALEEVAIANNISIPEGINSGVGAFFSGSERDSAKWALVAKMAAEVNEGKEAPVVNSSSSFCTVCKVIGPDGATHCITCGRQLPLHICPECETENPPQAVFCMSCGERR